MFPLKRRLVNEVILPCAAATLNPSSGHGKEIRLFSLDPFYLAASFSLPGGEEVSQHARIWVTRNPSHSESGQFKILPRCVYVFKLNFGFLIEPIEPNILFAGYK